jgi:histidinol phosphatase-like enzyme (inositol monophosphatase family)
LIVQHYPDHGIYGEEFGQQSLEKTYIWVIDPIDGTRAFIAGENAWGTLIALCENGVPILGILDQPITGERWVGVKGQPTLYNSPLRREEEIKTRPCAALANAELSTTSAHYFTPPQAKAFRQLAQQCATAIAGGDCYAYGLLARGARDVVVDAGLKPYDILALVPIITGAGGKITTWDGAAVSLTNYAHVVATGDGALEIAELLTS